MSRVNKPTVIGELKPGDFCTLPDGTRVMVTGQIDCATLWRYAIGERVDVKRGPMSSVSYTQVTDVRSRAATSASKAPDVDPLLGGAR